MSLITAIICAIFALLSLWHNKKTNNRYISLTFVFYSIWFLVSICSSVQLYGFEKPSFQATLLIFIMVLSFAVGSMLEKITRKTTLLQSGSTPLSFRPSCYRRHQKWFSGTQTPRHRCYWHQW